MEGDNNKISHATVQIGNSMVMISDSTDKFQPITGMLHLYVNNVDELYQQAIKAGGKSSREPTDEFYGERSAGVADEWGNQWWIATHMEDVNEEELAKRAKQAGR